MVRVYVSRVRYRKKQKQTEDEAQIRILLDDALSQREDDIIDDLGLDANEIIRALAEVVKTKK